MSSPSYTTKAKIEAYMGKDIDNSLDTAVSEWIKAASRLINRYTNNSFDNQEEVRYYNGNGEREILIDSFSSITSVDTLEQDGSTVNTSLTEDSDYFAFPLNSDIQYKLILTPDASIGVFTKGIKRLKVTANFGETIGDGDTNTPEDVVLVATMLTADIVTNNITGSGSGAISSESLGDYSISYDNDVEANALRLDNVKIIINEETSY